MTTATRINVITNTKCATAATNYSAISGTGGTAAGARATVTPYTGPGEYRVTWSVGTTVDGTTDGGASYLQTGLSAATPYAFAIIIRSSRAGALAFHGQYKNSSNTNVGALFTNVATTVIANQWTVLSPINATSGAAVDRVLLDVQAFNFDWVAGDTLDIGFLFGVQGTTPGVLFDGDTSPNNALPTSDVYTWNGTANASTSTDTQSTMSVAVSDSTPGGGAPQCQIVMTDIGPGSYTVQVTRQCEGETNNVPGGLSFGISSAAVLTDYAPPLQRSIVYNVIWNSVVVGSASYTQSATSAWICDPLQPDKSIPIQLNGGTTGFLTMDGDSLKEVVYPDNSSRIGILGASKPTLMGGQAQAGTKVPILLYSDDKATADAFRAMCLNSPILLLRPLLGMDPLPALAYMSRELRERPVNRQFGGTIASWTITGDIVQAVQQAVISGFVTYQNVQDLITVSNTYAQVQTKSAAKTYLDWQKNPRIWSLL